MGYIYAITNQINGKLYVGKTLNTIEERFKEHCRDSKKERCNKRPLYNAMNKYGIENFTIEILEECNSEQINNREIYWIDKLGTYHNGYNATLGGDGKAYINEQKVINAYKLCFNCVTVANLLNISYDSVKNILHRNNIAIKTSSEVLKDKCSKPIMQYDLKGNYIQDFMSLTDAAKWCVDNNFAKTFNAGVISGISDCARNKRKTAYKHLWRFK